jgi:hypothetical protein
MFKPEQDCARHGARTGQAESTDPNDQTYRTLLGVKDSDLIPIANIVVTSGNEPTQFPIRIFNAFMRRGWFATGTDEIPLNAILALTPNQLLHERGPYYNYDRSHATEFGKKSVNVVRQTLTRLLSCSG